MAGDALSERGRAEIERSAGEARKTILAATDRCQIDRYLRPRPDTADVLEYAFYLLGDIRRVAIFPACVDPPGGAAGSLPGTSSVEGRLVDVPALQPSKTFCNSRGDETGEE